MSRVDTAIRAAAGATVVGLAGIAGAISYSHMAELAHAHGETGWRAHMFPLSVDGIEIVASLVLLADKRASLRSGWLPWAALTAGTAASLAANVAVGGSDWIGRVVAGWPAFTLLVAVKLLFGLLEHPTSGRTTPAFAGPVPATGGDGPHAVRPVPVVTDEQPRTEHHPGTVPDRMTDDADRADPHPTDTDAQEHDLSAGPRVHRSGRIRARPSSSHRPTDVDRRRKAIDQTSPRPADARRRARRIQRESLRPRKTAFGRHRRPITPQGSRVSNLKVTHVARTVSIGI